ncbi:MAG TPA: hypothetical protein VJ370_19090 [Streptosporangiaceae bacterium]|jgi:hypothetical protein|nr:hypothetical protein [Streptosporangiaceae bacterium]
MSTSLPHSPAAHALATVLIEVERNLERLRASDDLEVLLELDLNDDDWLYHGPAERAERLAAFATREIDLHGCTVRPTPDRYGLAVQHGEYTVSVMFGRRLVGYVESGAGRPEI